MQIKRFEAADMADALLQVKEAFGENAVILSAKEVRPGGFFRRMRKTYVEITAAVDAEPSADPKQSRFSGILAEQVRVAPETDRVTLTSKPPKKEGAGDPVDDSAVFESFCSPQENAKIDTNPAPVDPTDGPFSSAKPNAYLSGRSHDERSVALSTHRRSTNPAVSGEGIAPPFYAELKQRKVIALVGGCGAGKSASVAKLAWHCHVVEKRRVALISLDRFALGANRTLEPVSRLLGLPLIVVYDAEQLQSALSDLIDVEVVLIDTPGVNHKRPRIANEIGSMLRQCRPDEIHLVANATVRQKAFAASAKLFLDMGANRLFLTHVDDAEEEAAVLQLRHAIDLPFEFYTDGVDLFDGLKQAVSKRLPTVNTKDAEKQSQKSFSLQRSTGEHNPVKKGSTVHRLHRYQAHGGAVVVNRHSELFHRPDCRSMRQIDQERMTLFDSVESALEKGFHPCLACCGCIAQETATPSREACAR